MREIDQSIDSRSDNSHGIKPWPSKKEIVVEWSINHTLLPMLLFSPKIDGKCSENSMRCEQISIKCLEDSLWSGKHRGAKSLPTRIWHDTCSRPFIQHCVMNIFPQTTDWNLESYGVWKAWFTIFRIEKHETCISRIDSPSGIEQSFPLSRVALQYL